MRNFFAISFVAVTCIVFLQSCGGGDEGVPTSSVEVVPNDILYPTIAANESTELKTVEVTLTAEESLIDYGTGTKTAVWAYNGVVPGPTIEANVGDKVIVHLINKLKEPTTIHFHGVELPANMDGSNIAQIPVEAGGKFTYTFTVNRAATYWYHPHARSHVQVERGLHGAFIVRDPKEDKNLNLPEKEHLIVVDDVKLDSLYQVAQEYSDSPTIRAEEMLNGREGNILLVNGKINPRITIKQGVPNRFRVINVANSRFMRLSIKDHAIWRIGGDAGLIKNSIRKKEISRKYNPHYLESNQPEYYSDPDPELGIFLTPGERAEFVFTPNIDATEITLDWHDVSRGRHIIVPNTTGSTTPFMITHDEFDGVAKPEPLATFELEGKSGVTFYQPRTDLRSVSKLDESQVTGPPIKIMYGHSQPDDKGNVTFFIKASMKMNPNFDQNSPESGKNKKMVMDKPLPFNLVTPDIADMVKPNETKIIEIINMTGGDHNFHLHGFMFQLLDIQMLDDEKAVQDAPVPVAFTEDKDTIIIPKRPGAMGKTRSKTRLIVKFNDDGRDILASGKEPKKSTSGGWVMHCHFLEHAERGMMSYIQVTP